MNKELRDFLSKEWFKQKVMALDFRGLDRTKVLDRWGKLFPDLAKPEPMVLFMGGFSKKYFRVTAEIDSPDDSFDGWQTVYDKRELFEELEKILKDNPIANLDITLREEEYAKNKYGRMDITGNWTDRGTIRIRNGKLSTDKEDK